MKGKIAMSLFSKVATNFSNEATKLPNRFIGNGFMPIGPISREPRNNSANEIINSIKEYAKTSPEIKEFAKHLDEMNPEHLGLAHDIIDLSKVKEMLPTNINLNHKIGNGKTLLGHILDMLPEVSKKNPGAIELTESVINNSDTTNAKYFIARLFDFNLPDMGKLSPQMKAVKEIVPTIAKDTLSSSYIMDFRANEKFFSFIKELASYDTKPENLKLLSKIHDIIEKTANNVQHTCDIWTLKKGNTERIKENLKILPEVLKNADAEGKPIKVAHFLENNINLD